MGVNIQSDAARLALHPARPHYGEDWVELSEIVWVNGLLQAQSAPHSVLTGATGYPISCMLD